VKGVGEPCAGEPHARFDGRGLETERTASPRQLPTQPSSSAWRPSSSTRLMPLSARHSRASSRAGTLHVRLLQRRDHRPAHQPPDSPRIEATRWRFTLPGSRQASKLSASGPSVCGRTERCSQSLTMSPIHDPDGAIIGLSTIAHDMVEWQWTLGGLISAEGAVAIRFVVGTRLTSVARHGAQCHDLGSPCIYGRHSGPTGTGRLGGLPAVRAQ
jgi:hypothetical protein